MFRKHFDLFIRVERNVIRTWSHIPRCLITAFDDPLPYTIFDTSIGVIGRNTGRNCHRVYQIFSISIIKPNPIILIGIQFKIHMKSPSIGHIICPKQQMLTRRHFCKYIAFGNRILFGIIPIVCQIATAYIDSTEGRIKYLYPSRLTTVIVLIIRLVRNQDFINTQSFAALCPHRRHRKNGEQEYP